MLNRINDNAPSQINGTLNANGVLYFVNPAGVQFGPGSVVNAASVIAAAGNFSNTDYLNNTDRFQLTGEVRRHIAIEWQSCKAEPLPFLTPLLPHAEYQGVKPRTR